MLEAVKGGLCLLETLEVLEVLELMRHVLLCMLEAVEGHHGHNQMVTGKLPIPRAFVTDSQISFTVNLPENLRFSNSIYQETVPEGVFNKIAHVNTVRRPVSTTLIMWYHKESARASCATGARCLSPLFTHLRASLLPAFSVSISPSLHLSFSLSTPSLSLRL